MGEFFINEEYFWVNEENFGMMCGGMAVAFREKWKNFAFEMTKSADKYLQGIKTENGI